MIKLKFFTENVAIAAFLGCLLGMAYVALLSSGYEENVIKFGTYGLTVLASLFASGLALAGVFANIHHQTSQADQKHQKALAASKAVLPIALTEVTARCRRGIEIRLKHNVDDHLPQQLLEQITLTETSLKILQSNVETANDENEKAISDAIARYAAMTARYGSRDNYFTQRMESFDDVSGHEGLGAAIAWAEVLLRFENCADYARGKNGVISTSINADEIVRLFELKMDYLGVDLDALRRALELWRSGFESRRNS